MPVLANLYYNKKLNDKDNNLPNETNDLFKRRKSASNDLFKKKKN